jgi:hypothetical protein
MPETKRRRFLFETRISENLFEKIEIRAIVFLCRWIEARLMLREAAAISLARLSDAQAEEGRIRSKPASFKWLASRP